jgi:predicted ATP-dependent endonuclease of OLD family
MKISKIELQDFYQFRNLTLHLVYPEGHPKAGQPLDRVCFIGQSGTGKTTLLNVIHYLHEKLLTNQCSPPYAHFEETKGMNITIEHLQDDNTPSVWTFDNDKTNNHQKLNGARNKNFQFVYFGYELLQNLDASIRHDQAIRDVSNINTLKQNFHGEFKLNKSIHLIFRTPIQAYYLDLKSQLIEYYEKIEDILRASLTKIVDHGFNSEALEQLKSLTEEKVNRKSPLVEFLDTVLNPLLVKIGLEATSGYNFNTKELDKKTPKINDFINIRKLNVPEAAVNAKYWSTGTKQIFSIILPLYVINPKNSVIAIDEVERSLYPDMQYTLIDYLTSTDNFLKESNNQFFFATHSPIIASAFEPWEIVELKFDDDGFVCRDFDPWVKPEKQEAARNGTTHVDDWVVDPRYLNWADIFMRVFELEKAGRDEHEDALRELFKLRKRLEFLGPKPDRTPDEETEFNRLMDEYNNLSMKIFAKPNIDRMPRKLQKKKSKLHQKKPTP